jgi:hypothetical protein
MARPHVILLAVLVASLPAAASAIEVDHAQLRVSARFGWTPELREVMQQEVVLEPATELSLSGRSSATISARARLDPRDRLEPGRPRLGTYAGISRPAGLGSVGTLELRDAFLETRHDSLRLRLGKQQVVWGSTDGFKILDAVNPQSFREFILDDFAASRIGTWAASLEASLGGAFAQLVWVPDTTVHELPSEDAWFAFRAPRFRFGAPPGAALPARFLVNRPDDPWSDGGIGLRVTGYTAGWDWSLVALSNTDAQPVANVIVQDGDPVLALDYYRRELFGFSFSTSAGSLALRGEAAAQPGRHFNARSSTGELTTVTRDQVALAVGADLLGPANTFFNVQVLLDHVRKAGDGLVRPATDWLLTLFARQSFSNERLFAELRYYASLTDGDGVFRPALRFLYGENTALSIRMDFFNGPVHGVFGQFADRDRVMLHIEHTF